jgi:hypothetical protein
MKCYMAGWLLLLESRNRAQLTEDIIGLQRPRYCEDRHEEWNIIMWKGLTAFCCQISLQEREETEKTSETCQDSS